MKKILNVLIVALGVSMLFASCKKEVLETAPAGALSGAEIFGDSQKAQSAVDGIYRMMYSNGWSASWAHENPGLATFTIVRSLMGEDHFMYSQGQGWFYFDYCFNTTSDWTNTSGRQYATWNLFYSLISQANYVTDAEESLKKDKVGQNVLGQAYAIRAFAYYCLYESFCQGNYTENKDKPGVPIYTKGTNKDTEGVGRGTIEGLFKQINGDFEKSIEYFTSGGQAQSHPSHIDLYTAYGLWARAALGQQDYDRAGKCAEEALKKPDLEKVLGMSELGKFNNRNMKDVLWAFEITADQAGLYGSFISHMAKDGTYGARGPQCVDYWLYEDGMSDTDERRAWGERVSVKNKEGKETGYYYVNNKFGYANATTGVADMINMRAEEMLITLAECKCRKGEYADARALLEELYAKRYTAKRDISSLTNSDEVSLDTHIAPVTLIDEILLQRRIELWCEGMGRVPDLRRLNLGYSRSKLQSEPTNAKPNDPRFILKIPLKEFDSNTALDMSKDQN